VDAPDLALVVVQQADEPELGLEPCVDLLGPLASQPALQAAIALVQMSAHADRPSLMKTFVAAAAGAAHQEIRRPVAHD
jgi:hypothetical protein